MSFVFGWGSFRQKSYDPHELGFNSQPGSTDRIELRQKYFHFFWIPFFPIGKKWAVRRNNKLYELPLEQEQQLKESALQPRTPWYTFIGTILVVGGLAPFLIFEKKQEAEQQQNVRTEYDAGMKTLNDQFNNTAVSDLYALEPQSYGYNYVLLKVQEIKYDSILFIKVETDIPRNEMTAQAARDFFALGEAAYLPVTLSKKNIQQALGGDVNYSGGQRGVELFNDRKYYQVNEIYK